MISLGPAKSWSAHNGGNDDPRYNRCSPNLVAIKAEMQARWGLGDLGCYGERNVRAGVLPSAHSHGAAQDLRYLEQIGRTRFLNEVVPWLIENSAELHLSAIHDYIGCRIWHAGRTSNPADAYTLWWRQQTANPATGMGQSWAGWVHLETSEDGWGDATPVTTRPLTFPATTPAPVPVPPPIVEDDDMAEKLKFIGVEGSPSQYLWRAGIDPIGLVNPAQRDLMLKLHDIDPSEGVTISPEQFAQLH